MNFFSSAEISYNMSAVVKGLGTVRHVPIHLLQQCAFLASRFMVVKTKLNQLENNFFPLLHQIFLRLLLDSAVKIAVAHISFCFLCAEHNLCCNFDIVLLA